MTDRRRLRCIVLVLLLMAVSASVQADIYRWIDEEGIIHLDYAPPRKIPPSIQIEIIPSYQSDSTSARDICHEGYEYYDVKGDSLDGLRGQLRTLGIRADDKVYAGYTFWSIKYAISTNEEHGSYCVASVRTDLQVRIRLPRRRWDSMSKALKGHEDGHKELAVQAAKEIRSVLDGLGCRKSREELLAAARALAGKILELHKKKQKEYDVRTNHGATQGAVL